MMMNILNSQEKTLYGDPENLRGTAPLVTETSVNVRAHDEEEDIFY